MDIEAGIKKIDEIEKQRASINPYVSGESVSLYQLKCILEAMRPKQQGTDPCEVPVDKDAEIQRLKDAICPDKSITNSAELVDFAKDLHHAFDKLCEIQHIEEENSRLKDRLAEAENNLRFYQQK